MPDLGLESGASDFAESEDGGDYIQKRGIYTHSGDEIVDDGAYYYAGGRYLQGSLEACQGGLLQ